MARNRIPQPDDVLREVRDFVALARSCSYLSGDRRISPKERSRWRITFRRLAKDAQTALRGDDVDTAASALGADHRSRHRDAGAGPVQVARPGPGSGVRRLGGCRGALFTECYLAADEAATKRQWRSREAIRADRADSLAAWHHLLTERLQATEAAALLDRLPAHPALVGSE